MTKNKKKELNIWDMITWTCVFVSAALLGGFLSIGGGPSMRPTYGKMAISFNIPSYIDNTFERGDIVAAKVGETNAVKRVVGLPGDTLYTEDGCSFYLNGTKLEEGYVTTETCTQRMKEVYGGKSWTLKENEYFLAGDNRNNSGDSRYYGVIPKNDIKSTAYVTLVNLK